MKAKISAWMDDELDRHELAEPLKVLASDPQAIECWRIYHLIGDAMHDCRMLSADFGSTGSSEFLSAWRRMMSFSISPLARAVRT